MTTLHLRKSIGLSPLRLACLPILIACFGLSPAARAVLPPPDGGYPGFNTAEGTSALFSLTTGIDNTALGYQALFHNTTGNFNTAEGFRALFFNISGTQNTATGVNALILNNGHFNTAFGASALARNTTGTANTATGVQALFVNSTGDNNNAVGFQALRNNTTGNNNNAFGWRALFSNTGDFNVAVGDEAGTSIVDGAHNVCIGTDAGNGIVSANNQVAINVPAAGPFADISNTCFIGSIYNQPVSDAGSAQDTFVDQFNVLGFVPSSRRFKHDIQPMANASEAILALKPVTFKYNSDETGRTQYGVIAEEVAGVAPDLVFRDKNGDVQTVRFEQIGAMLLNEFIKEHRTVEELKKEIAALTATVKEQAAKIQKVSAQLETSKPAPQIVLNDQ